MKIRLPVTIIAAWDGQENSSAAWAGNVVFLAVPEPAAPWMLACTGDDERESKRGKEVSVS
jgi:predicted dinucleotide-binding enzyme